MTPRSVTAFAPATVANVAVGFDILGFSVDTVGDEVQLIRVEEPGLTIASIEGIEGARELPSDPGRNCATAGLLKLLAERKPGFGFRVAIRKGIPLGSGMGGSAASSVAALVAANCFLPEALSLEELLEYAVLGEVAASGAAHADNVAPCLYGGLVLTRMHSKPPVLSLPVPNGIECVLAHPHLRLDTKTARGVLRPDVPLRDHVSQSASLARFLVGCFRGDPRLLRGALHDEIIEPQRAPLVKGFGEAKAAALASGAIGCSLSGSGPSVFAWAIGNGSSARIKSAIVAAFERQGVACDAWISPVSPRGARVLRKES